MNRDMDTYSLNLAAQALKSATRKPREQYGVYFIQNTTTKSVKIGKWSSYPEERLTALQTGSDSELILLAVLYTNSDEDAIRLEGELHIKFWHTRKHNEWFNYTRELEEYLKPVLAGQPIRESAETKLLREEIKRLLDRLTEQNLEINALRDARPSYTGQDSIKSLIREKACTRCTVKLLLAMSDVPANEYAKAA